MTNVGEDELVVLTWANERFDHEQPMEGLGDLSERNGDDGYGRLIVRLLGKHTEIRSRGGPDRERMFSGDIRGQRWRRGWDTSRRGSRT